MKLKKNYVIVGIILIVLAVFFYIKHKKNSAASQADSITVEAAPVKAGNIPVEISAIGTLAAAKNVLITTEVAGQVSKVLFTDGGFVKQGTPLIQLDDAVYRAKLESAKANLFVSETNYNRMVLLGKQGAVAKQAIEQANADVKEKKAILKESQVTVDKMQILAPFDGVIGKSRVTVGEYINVGQPIVTLTDTQHLRVEYAVSEKYWASLKLGQEVKLKTNVYPDKVFIGHVCYISPTINNEDRTVSIYTDVDNGAGMLTAGLFVNVTQSLGSKDNALLIPAKSLVPTIDGQQVYKIENGKATAVPVEIGERQSDQVQVIKGLALNDQVVIAGQQKLKDGTPVMIKN